MGPGGVSTEQRKRPRCQKLIGEFFGGNKKRKTTEDDPNSAVRIVQRMLEPKGREGRRASNWCAIYMDECEFPSTDEATREECCIKKTANCKFSSGLYIVKKGESEM